MGYHALHDSRVVRGLGRAFLYLSTDLTIRLPVYPSIHLSIARRTVPRCLSTQPIYPSICRRLDVAERGRVEDALGAEAPVGQHPLRRRLVGVAGAMVSTARVSPVRAHVICGEAAPRHRDQS